MNNTNDISYALRLMPGDDMRLSIERFVNENKIEAGWIVTCVGSLTTYSIRLANQKNPVASDGFFEIISLSGTVSVNGCHLHIGIADDKGITIGGHLLKGCIIYTTAEIVLTESGKYVFNREIDEATGWKELQLKQR